MTDYTDLIARLRDEAQYNGPLYAEAADALEAQARRIAELEVPLCVGETTIRLLAKEGACEWADGRALVAADELFWQDPYARIAELEAALKPFAAAVTDYEKYCLDYHGIFPAEDLDLTFTISYLRAARAALGEKE